jgi:hypothetical protein
MDSAVSLAIQELKRLSFSSLLVENLFESCLLPLR